MIQIHKRVTLLEYALDGLEVMGEILIFSVFLLLSCNKLKASGACYLWTNFTGSFFVLFALLADWNSVAAPWNIGFLLAQIGWLSVSSVGLYQHYVQKPELSNSFMHRQAANDHYPVKTQSKTTRLMLVD